MKSYEYITFFDAENILWYDHLEFQRLVKRNK